MINASLWQDFSPDEEIINEEKEVTSFYILVAGSVSSVGAAKISTLKAGGCFSEVGLRASAGGAPVFTVQSRL